MALGNSQSCPANLMKTQEDPLSCPLCSVALYMISKVVGCFSPSLLQDGHLVPKEKE